MRQPVLEPPFIYYLAHFPLSPLTLLPTPSLSATIHRC